MAEHISRDRLKPPPLDPSERAVYFVCAIASAFLFLLVGFDSGWLTERQAIALGGLFAGIFCGCAWTWMQRAIGGRHE
jgi:hypothetical protein